jgi:hypothetical protein
MLRRNDRITTFNIEKNLIKYDFMCQIEELIQRNQQFCKDKTEPRLIKQLDSFRSSKISQSEIEEKKEKLAE